MRVLLLCFWRETCPIQTTKWLDSLVDRLCKRNAHLQLQLQVDMTPSNVKRMLHLVWLGKRHTNQEYSYLPYLGPWEGGDLPCQHISSNNSTKLRLRFMQSSAEQTPSQGQAENCQGDSNKGAWRGPNYKSNYEIVMRKEHQQRSLHICSLVSSWYVPSWHAG